MRDSVTGDLFHQGIVIERKNVTNKIVSQLLYARND